MTGGSLKLFGSPWSAPGWMKTNGRMKGGARLRGEFNGKYYKTYAKYLRRFVLKVTLLMNFFGIILKIAFVAGSLRSTESSAFRFGR